MVVKYTIMKNFETVMIISFSKDLSRRLEFMKSEKITQQEDKLKYLII